MGVNIHYLNYLHTKGYISTEKNKILDIGPQNLLNATKDDIINFVRRQGAECPRHRLGQVGRTPRLFLYAEARGTDTFSGGCYGPNQYRVRSI